MGLLLFVPAASASHVQCGDTITTDTTLDSDLVDCPGNGVVIGANDVTLDLAGHTIDGNAAAPAGSGVLNSDGHDRVVVSEGVIREFHTGIAMVGASDSTVAALALADHSAFGLVLSGATSSLVQANSVEGNLGGLLVDAGAANSVLDNSLSDNSSFGLQLNASTANTVRGNAFSGNATGLRLERDADDNLVTQNSLSGDGSTSASVITGGIMVTDSSGNDVVDNTIADTVGTTGIGLHRADRNSVRRNRITGGVNDGILVAESESNVLSGNVVRDAPQGIGIVTQSHRNVLKDNRVSGGSYAGFFFQRARENTVLRNVVSDHVRGMHLTIGVSDSVFRANTVLRNQIAGIHLDGAYNFEVGDGNRFVANRVSDNAGDGLWSYVEPDNGVPYTNTLVRRNVFERNQGDGLDLDGPSNTVAQNRANHNGDLGIEAHPDVTDGGGNRATGNGNPAQCVGVSCK